MRFLFVLSLIAFRSVCFSSMTNQDFELFNQFKQTTQSYDIDSVFAYFGDGKSEYNQALKPCQEIVEVPNISREILEDQLSKIIAKDFGVEYQLKTPKIQVHTFQEPFELKFVYDWVFCLGDPSSKHEESEVFWNNVITHALKGVVVLNPQNITHVETALHKRGFVPDETKQNLLKSAISNSNFKNLRIFKNITPKTFLLSYVRSGSTWLSESIKAMSPSMVPASFINKVQRHTAKYQIDLLDIPPHHYLKLHDPLIVLSQSENSPNNKLIVIVRNYLECMISIKGDFETIYQDISNNWDHNYFKILELYDSWDPNQRILVYYEDLITDFSSEMKKIVDFLHIPPRNLEELMENYEDHRSTVLESYDRIHQLKSTGQEVFHHSKNVPLIRLVQMESIVKKKYPSLWEKYLQRYAVANR